MKKKKSIFQHRPAADRRLVVLSFSKPAAGRPPAGLDFGDLVSEKVKKLKIELFERFSIKSGLTDV